MFKKEVGNFKWDLEKRVKLKESEECGEIVGRAEYTDREDMYYVRYQAGDGRQVAVWWGENGLEEIPEEWLLEELTHHGQDEIGVTQVPE